MPRTSPIRVSSAEFGATRKARRQIYATVFSGAMILLAAEGLTNEQNAARLDTRHDVVSICSKRFFNERLDGLEERSRPGRPRTFPP